MPVALVRALEDRQVQMLDVPEQEFMHTMGTNVLCIKPGLVVALQGSPTTLELLQKAGVTVETFDGSELCFKTEGGPTCLVQPLFRSDN
jgi:N-dimethylarginine dimethylaminohydrolase